MVIGKHIKTATGLKDVSENQNGANVHEAQFAGTAESAFLGLREQIEARLVRSVEHASTNRAPKANGYNAARKEDAKFRPTFTKEVVPKGKKRDHHGNVLGKSTNGAVDRSNSMAKQDVQGDSPKARTLEEEMRELGGLPEDLDLIHDAESESEMEGDDKHDGGKSKGKSRDGMERGLQNIMQEIALAQGKLGALEDEPDESLETGEELTKTSANTISVVQPAVAPPPQTKSKGRAISSLKCDLRPDWFNASYLHQTETTKQPHYTLSNISLTNLRNHARELLETETQEYTKTQQHSSSNSFYNTVIASGTLSDKISALTLAVQESPLHNVKALGSLIGLAKKRSRAQAVHVLRALKDLFAQGSLLPSDRRLFTFAAQPGLVAAFGKLKTWNHGDRLPSQVQLNQLMAWYFEDWLKEQYFEVLKILEIWCNDEIEFSKSRAVSYVYELLKEKPEQESNLLRLLIDKLGDPIKKIASQTSYLLMQLLAAHPAMKETVISAIEADFLFRPGQSVHGKYYAIVTLNQTELSTQEEHVATKLLDIYFGLFVPLLKPAEAAVEVHPSDTKSTTRGERRRKRSRIPEFESKETELREKFIAAILTGVNRAFPYSDTNGHSLSAHLDTLFRITHSSNFNTSIQAMMLIQQMSSSHQASSDRFYRTLYESLLDGRLVSSSKQQLYLNLVHRSLKADLNLKRVKAFFKRILQILSLHEASFICAVFFLLEDLQSTYPVLRSLVNQPEEHDEEEETFMDVDDAPGEKLEHAQKHRLQRLATQNSIKSESYDGRKRDPEHSHANNSCAWELLPFLAHFHPAVAVSAENLSRQIKMPGKPDLNLHTLIHFLDRFVYKNPKLGPPNLRGSSIMQPMASSNTEAVLVSSAPNGNSLPVNTDQFRNQANDQVSAEDVFFHKYFNNLGKENMKAKASKADVGSDDDSMSDGEEDVVWKAMMDSAPDLKGVEDSDQDLSLSDLETDFDDAMADTGDEDEDDFSGDETEGVPILDDESDDNVDAGRRSSPALEPGSTSVEPRRADPLATKSKSVAAREKRKKMKGLPIFASAADYADALSKEDEYEDFGP